MSPEQSSLARAGEGEPSAGAGSPIGEIAAPGSGPPGRASAGSAQRTSRGLHPGSELLIVTMLGGLIIERAVADAGPDLAARIPQLAAGYGILMLLMALGLGLRARWRAALSSHRFGVTVLVVGTVYTALGTVVLQRLSPEQFHETYGAFAPVLTLLGLQDLFHGLPFSAALGLCAGGLLLAMLSRWPRTVRRWGAVLSHAGIVLVFAGAAVGAFWGVKGRIWLREGQSTTEYRVTDPASKSGTMLPLGFRLTLTDFEVQSYEPRLRLQVFEPRGDDSALVLSVDPGAAAGTDRAALAEHGVTLGEYWPDHATELQVTPLDAGAAGGVAALGLRPAVGKAAPHWLLDREQPGARFLDAGGARLGFFWSAARASAYLKTLGSEGAPPHTVRLASGESLAVEPGGRYTLADGRTLRVLRAFKDFSFDTKTRTPVDRSAQPRNPAIEVELLGADGASAGRAWLFAKFPSFHGSGPGQPGAGLTYVFNGSGRQPGAQLVAVGETAELWRVDKGEVAARQPLEVGGTLGVGDQRYHVVGLHERARVEHRDVSRSDVARNPAVRVAMSDKREVTLTTGRPLRLAGGEVLVLRSVDEGTPKDFISTLKAAGEGGESVEKRIEVNDPLAFEGLSIYQADYDPDDHTVSGFEVVRDPGLWLVYGGLLVCIVGVALVVFVAPRADRRRRDAAHAAA